jgi:alkyl hydroperoxide reductase subunit AhpC
MPRNTIQIRLMRIRISLHSAGCSSTKRVTIWNTPNPEAMTSITQAAIIEKPVVHRSMPRNFSFICSRDVENKKARQMELSGRPMLSKR